MKMKNFVWGPIISYSRLWVYYRALRLFGVDGGEDDVGKPPG